MKKLLSNKYVLIGLTLLLGVLIGWFARPTSHNHTDDMVMTTDAATGEQIWTCSMHPQIRRSEPGQCPICGMTLIPLESGESDVDPLAISMTPTAMQLASVSTAAVGTAKPVKSVRLNGKVQADERRIYSQSTHIPGRIEKLLVNYTGDYVKNGQTIAQLYSPELVTAQEELFQARKIKDTQPQLYRAAKEKLKNWKLSEAQIEQIAQSDSPKESFPIQADVSGYVTEKKVNPGDYVQRGEPIYEIVDLSRVWLLFDVYESDLAWVKKGDVVNFTVSSLPGENFQGKISFIDPAIDPMTRVAQARVEMSNRGMKLKPEMFASGTVEARLPTRSATAIVVPKSAVLWTGKRSVVYVKTSDRGDFMLREVILGPALGESYVIESGLKEGEEIAFNGTFNIDAAAQLAGKPSMMSPEAGVPAATGHNHSGMGRPAPAVAPTKPGGNSAAVSPAAKAALQPVTREYMVMKDALVNDKLPEAKKAADRMQKSLAKVSMSLFKGDSHEAWMKYSASMKTALTQATNAKDMEEFRESFRKLSTPMIALTAAFKPNGQPLYVLHCPMANNNKGADWLSTSKEVQNPYYGQSMLGCGEVTSTVK